MPSLPIRLSRLAAGTVAVCALSATAVGVSPVAAALGRADRGATSATSTLGAMAPRAADALTGSYGVVVHMSDGRGVYSDERKVGDALVGLGVRHIRTRIYDGRPGEWDALKALYARGIRADLVMGAPDAESTPRELVDVVANRLPAGLTESLEGANEWNLTGRPDWVRELRTHQSELYRAAKANPATAGLPVLAPALGLRFGFDELGDLSGMADIGNDHLYPGGQPPSAHIDELMAAERGVVGSKPIMFTEAGMHNAMNSTATHFPTPEGVAGVYAPKLLLEHFSRGVARVYNYELFDEWPDPAKVDREANFGLIRYDGTKKPAYNAMANLLALTADPGPAFVPSRLGYSVAGATPDVRQVLLQKRDGRSYLLLWRDVSVYDRGSETTASVPPVTVTVGLEDAADVNQYHPSWGPARTASAIGARSVPVSLAGDVVALEIAPSTMPTVPGAPRYVSAVAGDASAQVRWTAPASGPVPTGYRVLASPGGATATTTGSATGAVVGGLTNGATYTFTVTADGPAGRGEASERSDPVTPADPGGPPPAPTAPAAPTDVTAVAGNGTAQVTWTAARPGSSPVTGYRIVATPGGRSVTTTGPAETTAVVDGLDNGTAYTFAVTAGSAAGDSPAGTSSRPVTPQPPVAAPGTPGSVSVTARDGAVRVDWAAPASGGAVGSYLVTATGVSDGGGASTAVDGWSTGATLGSLTNGTAYTVTVTARNAAGSGPTSGRSAAVTPAPVPAAPAGIVARARNGAAEVRWPAAPAGARILGWTVTAAPGGATTTVPATATGAVVTGLVNGTAYTFTVRAVGPTGPSVPSAPTSPVVPVWSTRDAGDDAILRTRGT